MCSFMGSDVCRKPTPFSKLFCQGCVDLPHQQDQSQVHQSAGDIGDIPSLEDKMCARSGFKSSRAAAGAEEINEMLHYGKSSHILI